MTPDTPAAPSRRPSGVHSAGSLRPDETLAEAETILLSRTVSGAPGHADRTWHRGEEIDGLYRIEEVLGQGGMAVVYRALELATSKVVVIKSPLPFVAVDPPSLRRFVQEAEEWVGLGVHPNIVRAFTVEELEWVPRIIAQYVDGGDLSGRLRAGPVPPEEALRIAAQICWGVAYAHDRGLVHRDLKPANVLLSRQGEARIADFGLAQRIAAAAADPKASHPAGASTRAATDVLGTPEYMAPEQWDRQAGPASDIYSFGMTLYQLLCGRHPFELAEPHTVPRLRAYEEAHRHHPRPDPAAWNPALPAALIALMRACAARSPADRPGSFREIGRQLDEISRSWTGHPVPPEPPPEVLDEQARKDRAGALLRLGAIRLVRGEPARARKLCDQAQAAFEELGDPGGVGLCLTRKGAMARHHGDYEEARRLTREALAHLTGPADRKARALCAHSLAVIHRVLDEFQEAQEQLRLVQTIAEELGDDRLRIEAAVEAGNLHMVQDQLDRAEEAYGQGAALAEASEHLPMLFRCYGSLGRVARRRGDLARADELNQQALLLAEALDDRRGQHTALYNAGLLALDQGRLEGALAAYQRSLALAEALGYRSGISDCCAGIGSVYARQGRHADALAVHQRDVEVSRELGENRRIWVSLYNLAECHEELGALEQALALLRESRQAAEAAGVTDLEDMDRIEARIQARLARRPGGA